VGAADEEVTSEPEKKPRTAAGERRSESKSHDAKESAAPATDQEKAPAAAGTAAAAENLAGPAPEPPMEKAETKEPPPGSVAQGGDAGRVRISPVARRIAEGAGIDIAKLKGTGPDGRILRRDVEAAMGKAEAPEAPARPAERAAAPA